MREEQRVRKALQGLLYLPTPEMQGDEGWKLAGEDQTFELTVVEDDQGRTILPAFTSEDAMLRWRPEGSTWIAVEGRTVLELLADSSWDGVVVDGADSGEFAVARDEAARLVGGLAPLNVPEDARVAVGLPAKPMPEGFLEALRSACEREPAVREAVVYQIAYEAADEPPHPMIGLRLEEDVGAEGKDELFSRIGQGLDPPAWGYDFVDFETDGTLAPEEAPVVYRRAPKRPG